MTLVAPLPLPVARPPARPNRAAPVAAGLWLAVAVVIFHWPVTLGGGIFTDYDLFAYFYPHQSFLGEQLRRGELPLWNPYLFGGVPFLANIQTAVLYPPSWIAVLLPPPDATIALTLFHTWLAAAGLTAFGRSILRLTWPGALAAGLTFATGGFLTQQAAHPNQLAAAAWLPWLFLAFERGRSPGGRRWRIGGCLIVALLILAGHSQEAYYGLLAVGLVALGRTIGRARAAGWRPRPFVFQPLLVYLAIGVGGAALAAAQLLPTLELTRQGIRSGGLAYHDAVAFSLPPWLLLPGLLPFFQDRLPSAEFIGYLGLTAWALALTGALAGRHPWRPYLIGLSVAGLLLALGGYNPLYQVAYRVVPGVALFRVPARWLLWVAFGLAALAGIGCDRLLVAGPLTRRARRQVLIGAAGLTVALALVAPSAEVGLLWIGLTIGAVAGLARRSRLGSPRRRSVLLLAALFGELWLAGRPLTGHLVTDPQAWFSVRPAIAQVLIDPGIDRVLSLAASTFEPGDRIELAQTYGPRLGPAGLRALFVALKLREIFAPNLPLALPRATLDGYDGGLLPLRGYVAFKDALIEAARAAEGSRVGGTDHQPDGLIGRQLTAVPPTPILSALNVKYLVSDKIRDPWVDGVYYDLGLTRRSAPGETISWSVPTAFEATELGLVGYLEAAADPPPTTPVATVQVTARDGTRIDRLLWAGADLAVGLRPAEAPAAPLGVRVAAPWAGTDRGFNYLATVPLDRPAEVDRITIQATGPAPVVVRGLSLIDRRTGASVALPLRPEFTLVQSGDLKVYRNETVLPRGYLVEAATARRGTPADLPAVLADPLAGHSPDLGSAELTDYAPGRAGFTVAAARPAFLIFTETAYPGWRVSVDGQPAVAERANGIFQGVVVPAGRHRVDFRFEPRSFRVGAAISGLTLGLLALVWGWPRPFRRAA